MKGWKHLLLVVIVCFFWMVTTGSSLAGTSAVWSPVQESRTDWNKLVTNPAQLVFKNQCQGFYAINSMRLDHSGTNYKLDYQSLQELMDSEPGSEISQITPTQMADGYTYEFGVLLNFVNCKAN
jgi:hypothetical protein